MEIETNTSLRLLDRTYVLADPTYPRTARCLSRRDRPAPRKLQRSAFFTVCLAGTSQDDEPAGFCIELAGIVLARVYAGRWQAR